MNTTDTPKPDRSNLKPNFIKTPANDVLDIAWNEGVLSDGRPFRVEYWCQDQVGLLTFFFSTDGLSTTTDKDFAVLLEKEGLLKFKTEKKYVSAKPIRDASGNEMWSVNVVIDDDSGSYVIDSYPLKKYIPANLGG